MIIGNDDITPGLKEEAKRLLFQMLEKLHSISQDRDNLSESIRALGRMMQVKIEQQPWWPQYAQDHNYRQGGNKSKSFNQLKNKSNHRASKRKNRNNKISRRKNKKIKKKTLRLRL